MSTVEQAASEVRVLLTLIKTERVGSPNFSKDEAFYLFMLGQEIGDRLRMIWRETEAS